MDNLIKGAGGRGKANITDGMNLSLDTTSSMYVLQLWTAVTVFPLPLQLGSNPPALSSIQS